MAHKPVHPQAVQTSGDTRNGIGGGVSKMMDEQQGISEKR
jgi:hypothetical protein